MHSRPARAAAAYPTWSATDPCERRAPLIKLGGKAPLVMLDDVDIEAVVNGAAFGSFMNQGQICISTGRVIVQEGIAYEFFAAFAAKTRPRPSVVSRTAATVALWRQGSHQLFYLWHLINLHRAAIALPASSLCSICCIAV